METKKLKINCLGASNTRIIKTADRETVREVNYPVILGLLLRCTVRNYGVNGTNIAIMEGRQDSYFERAPLMDKDADIVILQGDGNDANNCVPLGEPGTEDVRTFRGAVGSLIDYIRRDFPCAELIIAAGMPKLNSPKRRADGLDHEDFHAAFIEVCRSRGIEPIDPYADPLMRADDPKMMPDGTHLSEKGCRYYAEMIAEKVAEKEAKKVSEKASEKVSEKVAER